MNPLPRWRVSYITNPEFQIRYGAVACGLGLGSFSAAAFLIYLAFYRVVESRLNPEISQQVMDQVFHPSLILGRGDVVIPLFVITAFLFCFGVIGTHRIAGPLFSIVRHLERLQTGKGKGPIRLRASDELQDLANTLNSFIQFATNRDESIRESLTEMESNLSKSDLEALRRNIAEIQLLLGQARSG